MELAVVARVVCRRVWHGRRLVLIDWEVPAEGWADYADAFRFENRMDLEGIVQLANASWRPLHALQQPAWSLDDWMTLQTWDDWLASHVEEDAAN
mmetsp:Transcript_16237/g.41061  ORF Transcript_16237/g.41061 Transcript_16237/m.41061 type:complete len:95 (-) Transcript_16237:163-447(-)|eukprot:CAMPEP_0174937916 /NCGR_PEP_ID=MMETSP1355-20121228/61946_1 /TAXON_ID=464990 /ORGANISM="Hemiselmis tepida, Strain CCMP443" /LENGTH=94 /DNA_ID=CAMNT_0016184797 /DNA_START=178 /DNA_END=462 /DNA_ORIENTATION=-